MYIFTYEYRRHTHTHTHIYIYIYMCMLLGFGLVYFIQRCLELCHDYRNDKLIKIKKYIKWKSIYTIE